MISTKRKIISILCIISPVKSSFLQAIVHSDILESDSTTNTKFPCIIKIK